MKPGNKTTFWDVIVSIGMAEIVTLFVMIGCFRIMTSRLSYESIKADNPYPLKKNQIFLAKFTVVFLYAIIIQTIKYISLLLGTFVFFGLDGIYSYQLLWIGKSIVCVPGIVAPLIANGLDFLEVLVYIILAFTIFVIIDSRAIAMVFFIFAMFGGGLAQLVANNYMCGKYIFFANTYFSSYIVEGAPFYGITLGLALSICAVYSIVFLLPHI